MRRGSKEMPVFEMSGDNGNGDKDDAVMNQGIRIDRRDLKIKRGCGWKT